MPDHCKKFNTVENRVAYTILAIVPIFLGAMAVVRETYAALTRRGAIVTIQGDDAIWTGMLMVAVGMFLLFSWMPNRTWTERWLAAWGCVIAMMLGGMLWGFLDPRSS